MKENKLRNKIFIKTVGIILVAIVSFFAGFLTNCVANQENWSTLNWLVDKINKNYCYFDEQTGTYQKFTKDDIYKSIVNGLLDDYSAFYTREEYQDLVYTKNGNRYGIGISVSILPNDSQENLKVYSVTMNSPAERAGILEGDFILGGKASGNRVNFNDYEEFDNFVKGIGENVLFTLYIERQGTEIEISLAKEVFVSSYVLYKDNQKTYSFSSTGQEKPIGKESEGGISLLENDTAYIKFVKFEGDSANQLKIALEYMQARNKTKLILDLRKNGGGQLSILKEVGSYLLYKQGVSYPVVTYSKDVNNNYNCYTVSGNNYFQNIEKISVIADNGTASASECLIGALTYYQGAYSSDYLVISKDNGIAKTYGKGIGQTTYLNTLTGEAVKFTTEYMYWPDKTTCIHGKGIQTSAQNSVEDKDAIQRANQVLK